MVETPFHSITFTNLQVVPIDTERARCNLSHSRLYALWFNWLCNEIRWVAIWACSTCIAACTCRSFAHSSLRLSVFQL